LDLNGSQVVLYSRSKEVPSSPYSSLTALYPYLLYPSPYTFTCYALAPLPLRPYPLNP
jgi:hypothetical protein